MINKRNIIAFLEAEKFQFREKPFHAYLFKIAYLVSKGYCNDEIESALNYSKGSMHSHISALFKAFNLSGNTDQRRFVLCCIELINAIITGLKIDDEDMLKSIIFNPPELMYKNKIVPGGLHNTLFRLYLADFTEEESLAEGDQIAFLARKLKLSERGAQMRRQRCVRFINQYTVPKIMSRHFIGVCRKIVDDWLHSLEEEYCMPEAE